MLFIIIPGILFFYVSARIGYKRTSYHLPNEVSPYKGIDGERVRPYRDLCLSLTDAMCAKEFEDIYTKAYDGTPLRARFFRGRDERAPFVIMFHGYRSMPLRDFAGINRKPAELGYNIIMVDHRAHGKSGGHTISFGGKESRDAVRWAKYVAERFGSDVKIILLGISMGGATVISASAKKELPSSVCGIVADCPFSSAKGIIIKVMKDLELPVGFLYPFVRLGSMIFGGYDPSRVDIALAAKKTNLPILLIHGVKDSFVPHAMSEKIAEAPTVEFHSFPDGEHGTCYLSDPERYERLTEEFMTRVISQK